jgi:glycine cleavage system H protein
MKNVWGKELTFPEDVLYTPELLWIKVEPEKLRIGISDLGIKSVKQLIYVRMACRVGTQVKKGDTLGMVETSKMVWEIVAPVSGVVIAINGKIFSGNTIPITRDPYGEGWLVEMEKVSETESELQGLLKGGEVETEKWIQEQAEAIIPLAPDGQ